MDYIVKYQNNLISSFLFAKNFPELIEKGIEVKKLLDSSVFNYEFDLDEWPSSHFNPDECLRPFNENLFMIRKHYRTVFPENDFTPLDEITNDQKLESSKIYKIKYSVNMLPAIGTYLGKEYDPYTQYWTKQIENGDINVLGLCAESDELAMFESETLRDLIAFKWAQFGMKFHLVGFFVHIAYIIILFMYTNLVYVHGFSSGGEEGGDTGAGGDSKGGDESGGLSIILLCGVLYPAIYETVQMAKDAGGYFEDLGNYVDLVYIWGSVAMSILHMELTPYHFVSKVLMALIVTLAIRRTFNFLRIFEALSPIVTMLNNVIWELRIFLTFYFILVLLFSLMYGVIGIGNYKLAGPF